MSLRIHATAQVVILLLFVTNAVADNMTSVNVSRSTAPSSVDIKKTQVHFRTGFLTGKFNGTFRGEFEVSMAFDLEYEMFKSNTDSFLFRFIQGLDSSSVPFYTYAGTGLRHYINSKGPSADQREKGTFITARPKIRTYIGGDAGIAQIIVKSFGPNVQSVANMLDVGLNLGAIYQVSETIGLEIQLGGTLGYGISSTPQNGHTLRSFVGGSYFF